jgi:hypothetical protein
LQSRSKIAAARKKPGKIAKARSIGGKTARQTFVISARDGQIP